MKEVLVSILSFGLFFLKVKYYLENILYNDKIKLITDPDLSILI